MSLVPTLNGSYDAAALLKMLEACVTDYNGAALNGEEMPLEILRAGDIRAIMLAMKDAARYQILRNQDIEPPAEFPRQGVFIGEIRDAGERDVCLTHSDADRACDAMLVTTSNGASTK